MNLGLRSLVFCFRICGIFQEDDDDEDEEDEEDVVPPVPPVTGLAPGCSHLLLNPCQLVLFAMCLESLAIGLPSTCGSFSDGSRNERNSRQVVQPVSTETLAASLQDNMQNYAPQHEFV